MFAAVAIESLHAGLDTEEVEPLVYENVKSVTPVVKQEEEAVN